MRRRDRPWAPTRTGPVGFRPRFHNPFTSDIHPTLIMHAPKAATSAFLLLAVALSGCTGGDDALGISVTPSDDPVTEPYTFTATGSADRFLWNFNDGTPIQEGRTVEHTFGFTDGIITVKLTAETGGEAESVSQKLTLGTGQNNIPSPGLAVNTDWVTPSDTFIVSGAPSTDPNGDPLLYRWSCSRVDDLQPAPAGHADEGGGALPFGVQVAATIDPQLTEADTSVGSDLCAGLGDGSGPFSRDASVSGTFTETGVYDIRMEMRDPKSASFVGMAVVFVSNSIPPANSTENFEGTLNGGSGGDVQPIGDELGVVLDEESHEFTVPISNRFATITFDASSPGGAPVDVRYRIETAGGTGVVLSSSDEEQLVAGGKFLKGVTYVAYVTLESGAAADYTLDLDIVNDLNPKILYADPYGHGH